MSTANVIAFPPTRRVDDDVDVEEVGSRAAMLDVLAEILESIIDAGRVPADEDLPEELRTLADSLFELVGCEPLDVVAIRRLLPRADELVHRAAEPICHANARRMLGASLYSRVSGVIMLLGELGTYAHDRMRARLGDARLLELPIRRFGRATAQAYDWASWNIDAPIALREELVNDIQHAAAHVDEDDIDVFDDVDLPDPGPLATVLGSLLAAWKQQASAGELDDLQSELARLGEVGSAFELGVACSLALRLLAADEDAPITATCDILAWDAACSAT